MTQVFGQVYAPLYDLFYQEKNYDGEVELLCQLFRRYAAQPIWSVLDMGCGTGNHALRLADSRYRVVGVDCSPEMLAIAERKAQDQRVNLELHQADMRYLDLAATFDAVIMMFAVLGYQIANVDVLATLQTARRHLHLNGLLLFDIWYGPAVLAQGTQQRIRTIRNNGKTWTRTSLGELETKHNVCRVEFLLRQLQDNVAVSETSERHIMRYFFLEEIDQFLGQAGFRLLRLGEFPELGNQPNDRTWNIMAVAVAA